MTKLNVTNILTAIMAGDLDNDLSKIRDAMEFRMDRTASAGSVEGWTGASINVSNNGGRTWRVQTLRVGQPVYFAGPVSLEYLRGVKAFMHAMM